MACPSRLHRLEYFRSDFAEHHREKPQHDSRELGRRKHARVRQDVRNRSHGRPDSAPVNARSAFVLASLAHGRHKELLADNLGILAIILQACLWRWPVKPIAVLARFRRILKKTRMTTTYETGPLYHYAETEPDIYNGDFVETAAAQDEGYLPVDVEYERPNRRPIPQQPAPPRRLSIVETPSAAPTLPPPRTTEVSSENPPRSNRIAYLGLLGLVGLAGLGGAALGGSSTANSLSATGPAGCIIGSIMWSASSSVAAPGYVVADGSAVSADVHPEYAVAVGNLTPNLIGRYARGGLDVGTLMDASVDAGSLSVRIFDPGHSHVDSSAFSVLRDGQYSLAHLYSFKTSGMNLRDSGPGIVASETGITAEIDGGSETRPASVVLVPYVCIGIPKIE